MLFFSDINSIYSTGLTHRGWDCIDDLTLNRSPFPGLLSINGLFNDLAEKELELKETDNISSAQSSLK